MSEETENKEMPVDETPETQDQTAANEQSTETNEQTAEATVELNEEEKLRKEVAEWKDKYTRLFAEFDNFRKRSMKERSELISGAAGDVIKELLPIIDDFDRAVKANEATDDVAVIKEGFVLIHNKMYRKLESKGLKPLDATGKPFDTDFHEAITSIPAPTEDLKGKVVDEVEKGYLLNEKVLRYSKVVIGQ
ncbi:MAG: nucleotide exchange factor GrpE [Flavobacteriales bacterium]